MRKITFYLNAQKEAEIRLFGFDQDRYQQQDKGLKNLKTTLHIYAGMQVVSMVYALVRFIRTQEINLDSRIDSHNVHQSAYQTITGNYDVDFIIKLFCYYNILMAWQIPFIYLMWPKIKTTDDGKRFKRKTSHRDPRDSTKEITLSMDLESEASTHHS